MQRKFLPRGEGGARWRDGWKRFAVRVVTRWHFRCRQRSAGKCTLANGNTSGLRAGTRRCQKGIFEFYRKKKTTNTTRLRPRRMGIRRASLRWLTHLGWKGGVRTPLSSQDVRGSHRAPLLPPAPARPPRRRLANASVAPPPDATVPPVYSYKHTPSIIYNYNHYIYIYIYVTITIL